MDIRFSDVGYTLKVQDKVYQLIHFVRTYVGVTNAFLKFYIIIFYFGLLFFSDVIVLESCIIFLGHLRNRVKINYRHSVLTSLSQYIGLYPYTHILGNSCISQHLN